MSNFQDWAHEKAENVVDIWGGRFDAGAPIFILEDAIAQALLVAVERGREEEREVCVSLAKREADVCRSEFAKCPLKDRYHWSCGILTAEVIEETIRSRSQQGEG